MLRQRASGRAQAARLLATVFLLVLSSLARGADNAVRYETLATWLSAGGPEAHVLLQNLTDERIDFDLRFRPREMRCAGPIQQLVELDPRSRMGNYFRAFVNWHRTEGAGVLPAKGWAHRSTLLFLETASLPCEVPFKIVLDAPHSRVIDGTVVVKEGPPARALVNTKASDVSADVVVEDDEGDPRAPTVRLLVRNLAAHPVRVEATERGTVCAQGAEAGWASIRGVLQGENTGPLDIAPGGWGVLVDVVRARKAGDLADCRGWIMLEGTDEHGAVLIDRIKFPLQPAGKHGRLFIHSR